MVQPPVRSRADVAATSGLNLPNLLSVLRLVAIPLFLWLVLGPHADGWAVLLLMASGATDWLDGKIARAWGQVSRLGQLLDPLADRLYVITTLGALTVRDVFPWWVAVVLLGREAFLAGLLPVLQRHGYGPLPVHFLGKAGTFCVLSAFPLVLLGAGSGLLSELIRPIGWAFLWWGMALYWWAFVLYAVQTRALVRAAPAAAVR